MKIKTKKIALSAIMIGISLSIALLFELVPLKLPYGGSFTIASMLPIIVIAYIYGVGWGLVCGGVYSVLQLFISMRTVSAMFLPGEDGKVLLLNAILITLFDYILAYSLLGLGGATRRMKNKTSALVLGSLIGLGARYICHIVSGAIFYGEWAEWFFSQKGLEWLAEIVLPRFSGFSLALVYSTVYNGLYMIPEIIITALAAIPVSRISQVRRADEAR